MSSEQAGKKWVNAHLHGLHLAVKSAIEVEYGIFRKVLKSNKIYTRQD